VTSNSPAAPQHARPDPATYDDRSSAIDLLQVPGLGRFLRWRYSRRVLQIPLLLVSLIMVAHAFWGPQLAPKNLATLLTWVHFRGLVVLVILVAGNTFCMACPFLLPRELTRRFHTPRWEWPRRLRNKWPAIVLLVTVLFAYELFDLWGDPWWTGVFIVSYFAAATVVDTLFRRASFCKYVCPVGQFNFLSSTMSPWEVSVRDPLVCTRCETKDCIRGVRAEVEQAPTSASRLALPIVQRGCELDLFQPRKIGNLDCTFCLDCVYACPHDNIGLLARIPAEELAQGGTRSGIGKLERRTDYSVLMTVFTFGALLNAFAMISPVYALEQWIADVVGLRHEWPILFGLFAVALVIEPAVLLGAAALATRRWTPCHESVPALVKRFARSLVPLGFGVWLAHYGFHFFTGFLTIIPVAQNAALEAFGRAWLGQPLWELGGLSEAIVYPMEIGFMCLGLLGSWLVTWLIVQELTERRRAAAVAPWATLHLLLFGIAVWIMNQPMDMRGTYLGG
jgi:ferredoxin